MKYQGLVAVALLLVLAASALAVFSLSGNGEQGAGPGPGISTEFFQVDRVYLEDWTDYTGQVSPHDFAVVVEITSGGRGVGPWSVGIDRGDGFIDNIIEMSMGGAPDPENHKLVLREDIPKVSLPTGTYPQKGQSCQVKLHLTLTDNTPIEWEGYAEYL
jgi:hypothetical protein